DLAGLLRQVRDGKKEYLRDGSTGLACRTTDKALHSLRADKARVVRQGPLAAALRFEGSVAVKGGPKLASTVEMTFPRSKSWVEVAWTVADPTGEVASLEVDLRLLVPGGLALVDFGAGSLVYTTLSKGESALLRVGGARTWEVLRGPAGQPRPFVV